MSLLERVFYFHQEVLKGTYPNSRTLTDQFELSAATAKRDITYLRDRLLAPLVFDRDHNGYYYSEKSFALPFEESPKIVFLLTMLNKFAGEAGLGDLSEVKQLEDRLSSMLSNDYGKLIDRVYCEWIETESISHRIFEVITEGVVHDKVLQLEYRSLKGESSSRLVAPRRIINYQGRGYLLGYCQLRKANRLFHIARVHAVKNTGKSIPPSMGHDEQNLLEQSFGIFTGKPFCQAEILFTSTAAALIRNQHWHRDQQIEEVEDGVLLSVPVSDYREITMKILQYGKMAKVVKPAELKRLVQDEISAMVEIYASR